MSGGGLFGPPRGDRPVSPSGGNEQLVDVICAECGLVYSQIPISTRTFLQDQHERTAHPEIHQLRQDLELQLRELNLKLWSRRNREV